MQFKSGRIAGSGPTAAEKESMAASRSEAFRLSRIRSKGRRSSWDWRVGGLARFASPRRLLITRPVSASWAARFGRTRKVTSRPASSNRPPKYPPMAPAPITRIFMAISLGAGSYHNGGANVLDGRAGEGMNELYFEDLAVGRLSGSGRAKVVADVT